MLDIIFSKKKKKRRGPKLLPYRTRIKSPRFHRNFSDFTSYYNLIGCLLLSITKKTVVISKIVSSMSVSSYGSIASLPELPPLPQDDVDDSDKANSSVANS